MRNLAMTCVLAALLAGCGGKGTQGKAAQETANIPIDMVFVEGGTFMMGCTEKQGEPCDEDEEPAHSVTVSNFYLGKFEVTQELWKSVMGYNPSEFYVDDRLPVESANCDDALVFIRKLNAMTGKKYRLPTGAEWEFAARGGKISKGYKYSGGNNLDEVAWHRDNSDNKTHPVGTKLANELGLHDMTGNVDEWTTDAYDWDPNIVDADSVRVTRGGSWMNSAEYCRISKRGGGHMNTEYSFVGIRLAMSAGDDASSLPEEDTAAQKAVLASPPDVSSNPHAIAMVFVEGGTFKMGCTEEQGNDCSDLEKPAHSVTVGSFSIGKYPVTQGQWKAVMERNPSKITGDKNFPVEWVSWNYAQNFILRLNKITGKKYRLPTEAEWEYAARGGNRSKGYKFSGSDNIEDVGWYLSNSGDKPLRREGKEMKISAEEIQFNNNKPRPVGTKQPNELEIHDMSGSVFEWVGDINDYGPGAQVNPAELLSCSTRIFRGGGWLCDAADCRVSKRTGHRTNTSNINLGLRLAHDAELADVGFNLDSIAMIFVEGGTFMMGCTEEPDDECGEDEKPTHSVTLSSFSIGKYEVTQLLWRAVMGGNPSHFTGNDNLPVETVGFDDVQEFIRKLNAKTGKKYRLPTEAEWEYAARGGNSSRGYKYSGSDNIDEVAWYGRDFGSHYDASHEKYYSGGNSDEKPHPVGMKSANELGIFDMSGNVAEWVSDGYKSNYYRSSQNTNPTGPSTRYYRVYRGGNWMTGTRYCRVSSRHYGPSKDSRGSVIDLLLGFRLALDP
jgi:formylglycine-generating enzyme required for sulfatase activity